jgi:hypothetical protein
VGGPESKLVTPICGDPAARAIHDDMPLMTIFEPLFVLLALAAIGTFLTALALALTGHFARAWRIVVRLGIAIGVYMMVVVIGSAVTPRGVYHIGQLRCFDDWCLTVRSATRDSPTSYLVTLELSSRAKGVPQGEKGTVMYLTDSNGRRFDPIESTVPFEHKLAPGESIVATRRYAVPPDARGLNLIYTHEGGFPIGSLIIGENEWIHGPAVVPLD